MDHFFHPQNQKHSTANKQSKKRLTQDQVKLLEISFTTNKKLDPERKLRLAKELGVPPRQVAIWFQNKRARWKTQSLEYDYGALQVKLESAMTEKRQVEKEVERLRGELKRAQEMLNIGVNNDNNNNSSCDERGSSSLHEGDVHHWINHGGGDEDDDHGVLQLEELYACFVGGDGGSNNWG